MKATVLILTVEEATIGDVIGAVCENCDLSLLEEVLVVYSKRSSAEYVGFLQTLDARFPGLRVRVCCQPGSGTGDALYYGFSEARGTHVITAASDAETNPADIGAMLSMAARYPDRIVTASRRLQPGGLRQYPLWKKLFGYLFQTLLKVLFRSRQTDITFPFQCTPVEVFRGYAFSPDHSAFVLELALQPELSGVPFTEIPSSLGKRKDGVSHTTLRYYFGFLKAALGLYRRNRKRMKSR